jgi:hypothetical protein
MATTHLYLESSSAFISLEESACGRWRAGDQLTEIESRSDCPHCLEARLARLDRERLTRRYVSQFKRGHGEKAR